jgi:hypothetical protein
VADLGYSMWNPPQHTIHYPGLMCGIPRKHSWGHMETPHKVSQCTCQTNGRRYASIGNRRWLGNCRF